MVRTVDSPRCCATSSTSRLSPFLVSSEFKIAGRLPSNWTSTTAPITWVMFPVWLVWVAMLVLLLSICSLQRFRAGNNLDQFLGDHRLTGAVIFDGLLADHVAGVASRIVHRGHLRAVERGGVLEKSAEDLRRDITRQQVGEDFLLLRLIFIGGARTLDLRIFELRRNDL